MKPVCQALGVARSHVIERLKRPGHWQDRRRGRRPHDDSALLVQIRQAVHQLDSYGYRRACELVNRRRQANREPGVNVKRIYRVMREHGLLLQRHTGRPADTRGHNGRVSVDQSDLRWCSDGFEITCDNKQKVRVAFSLDCCDREAISWIATTGGIDAAMVCDLMVESVEARFGGRLPPKPIEWLTDNGSPYVARQTQRFASEVGLVPLTTPISSPQSNGMAESFVKTFKRDYVRRMDRSNAASVIAQLPSAFEHYNEVHPHSALKMKSPRMFRRAAQGLHVNSN